MSVPVTCARCVMDDTVPDLRLDATGVCHLCHVHDRLERAHRIGGDPQRLARFREMVVRIKKSGVRQEHDCVVPLSGGADSSYTLWTAVRLGLRPLAYHLDNGWVSDLARDNVRRVTRALGVPVRTVELPWEGWRDAYLAALRASIPEVCLPCLVAVFSLPYLAAAREGIRTVLFSSSPATEGIAPLSWSYVDGRYLASVVARHGGADARRAMRRLNRLRAVPLATGSLLRRVKVIMLPLYVDWDDDVIRDTLRRETGWVDGGKHADCLYTPFRDQVIWRKFGFDVRRLGLAARVRSGAMAREEALRILGRAPREDRDATALVLRRLGLDRAAFEDMLAAPPRGPADFDTFRPAIRRLGPLIRVLTRRGFLSEHVYDKFFEC